MQAGGEFGPGVFSNVRRRDKTGSDIIWVTALLVYILKIIRPGRVSIQAARARPRSALIQDQRFAAGARRRSNLCGPLTR